MRYVAYWYTEISYSNYENEYLVDVTANTEVYRAFGENWLRYYQLDHIRRGMHVYTAVMR